MGIQVFGLKSYWLISECMFFPHPAIVLFPVRRCFCPLNWLYGISHINFRGAPALPDWMGGIEPISEVKVGDNSLLFSERTFIPMMPESCKH